MFAQYLRLHVPAGASDLAVIRAARLRLDPEAIRDPGRRQARHAFYRDMLEHHRDVQDLAMLNRL